MVCGKFLVVGCCVVILALVGCDSGPTGDDSQTAEFPSLPGTTWQIEDIDESGIVDRSMITLQFTAEGGVAGNSGCNRYFGNVELQGDQLSFSQLGNTRRACVPALMQQEQRFLVAMQSVGSYQVDERDFLLLFDTDNAQRLKAVRIKTDPTAASGTDDQPQDRASEITAQFDCGSSGIVDVRFVGPETLQFTRDGATMVLQRVRSGSGARYAGDQVEFFNKGDTAMLNLNGVSQNCSRVLGRPY